MRRKIGNTRLFASYAALTLGAALAAAACQGTPGTGSEIRRELIRRVITEAWNEGNLYSLGELYAVDFVRHRPPFPDYRGLDTHRERIRLIRRAYPDHRTIIRDIIIEGDRAAVWYVWEGTHTGEGLSLPPTGRKVSVNGCDVFIFKDGKVAEEWDNEGFLGLFRQLGYEIVPPGGGG